MSAQSTARRILRDAARTATLGDLWIATDEEDLEAPDPAGSPDLYDEDGIYTLVYLWVDTTSRVADLSVRWVLADGSGLYQAADELDVDGAGYGDVSLRYVGGVSRAARARLAAIVEVALRERGYDPAAYSIGGDPR